MIKHRILIALIVTGVFACAGSVVFGQGTATHYVYDDNGRLKAVIAPNGEANVYEYDPAGNVTAIRRNTSSTLEVLEFYPREGIAGTQVTIVGTGFGGGVSSVAFNGTAAQEDSLNAPVLIVTVPNGATTGPITVTTPGGSFTTSTPFTVKGIRVTPASSEILSRRSIQFTATVFVEGNQGVVWTVEGIDGGSSVVGTISINGLYASPTLPASQTSATFRIRATSISETSVFGEAVVLVRNSEFIRTYYTGVVSVLNGNSLRANSAPLSVLNGNQLKADSAPLSVLNGNQLTTYSPSLSMLNGNQLETYSPPLSVLNGNLNLFYSSTLSVTTGPAITAISPGQVVRGATTGVTITGENLSGATELMFINASTGAVATGITASGINVNGAGTALTANLTVGSGVSPGRYLVAVTTPNEISPTGDGVTNVIEVIP